MEINNLLAIFMTVIITVNADAGESVDMRQIAQIQFKVKSYSAQKNCAWAKNIQFLIFFLEQIECFSKGYVLGVGFYGKFQKLITIFTVQRIQCD